MSEQATKLNKEEARQGDSHHTNYRVLIWSSVLALVALLVVFLIFGMGG